MTDTILYMREKYGENPKGICCKCKYFLKFRTSTTIKRRCVAYAVLTGTCPEWQAHFTACGLYTREELSTSKLRAKKETS